MVFGIDDLITGGGSVLGGVLGGIFGGGDKKQAQELQKQALSKIQNVSLPSIEELQIHLADLVSQGQITPEMEQAALQEASQMQGIQSDPRLKDAQMAALAKMQDLGNEGLSAQNRMVLNDARRTVAQDSRARDEAILQNMAARGAGGSGVELAARLASSQGQADRAGQESDRIAAMANQQALEAIMKSGQLGGDIRTQDFSEQARIAEAQDAINRFNTANKQASMSTNTLARNQAQASNLANAQRIADANVGSKNQSQIYNKEVLSDDYARRMQKAQSEAQALGNQANNLLGQAANTSQAWSNIGSGVGKAAAGAFGTGSKAKVAPANTQFDMEADNTENNYKMPVFGAPRK